MKSDQIFFRPDELEEARELAIKKGMVLREIVDRRSINPKPRMLVLDDWDITNVLRLKNIGMWKRMWTWRLV